MASPTMRRGTHQVKQAPPSRFRLPLLTRRLGAWAVEVSLVVVSAVVPYSLGLQTQANFTGELVPLNPVLAITQESIAKTLGIPLNENNYSVAPLTNLFWTGALVLPLIVASTNLFLLGRTGKTLPKRWLGVRVVTPSGAPPGLARVFIREGIIRWGLPVGTAYLIWRYTGAFPDLGILVVLVGLFLLAECISTRLNSRRRALHDRLAGTFVTDATQVQPYSRRFQPLQPHRRESDRWEAAPHWTDEDAAIAAIVLTPEPGTHRKGLWAWMRQHPGLTLLIVSLSSMALVLGTFVGTQVYIQSQANQREFKQQDNEVFLTLVSRLAPQSSKSPDDRQSAILALGAVQDARALPLLVDLLSQADVPNLIDTLQQTLVSKGPEALPYLRRLNQSLKNDLESLRRGSNQQEQTLAALRQRATQRAIAKILTIYSGQIHAIDLSRIDLGQTATGPAQFTLVLEQTDLSGMQFKGAILKDASLRGSRFYGPGEDQRWGTFDDWIADFSGAELKSANLSNAFLSHVIFYRTNLIRTNLNKANLVKARLTGANLSSAKLMEADLRQAVLQDASLTGADLGDADLSQANLRSARLGQASAIGARFQLADLTESDWQGADLSGANFSQANLKDANLSSTRLVGTNLSLAQLQNVNFRNADLSMTDLRGANLEGADFQGAIFVRAVPTSPDQFIKLTPVPGQSGLLRGVNFTKVRNLTTEQLTYICAQGGQHPKCL